MTKSGFAWLATVLLVAGIGYGLTGTTPQEAIAEQTVLQLLVVADGEPTEVSVTLSAEEMEAVVGSSLAAALIEGEIVDLSVGDPVIAAFLDELNVDANAVHAKFGLVAAEQEQEASWACLKCCYADEACACCPDSKDPVGD